MKERTRNTEVFKTAEDLSNVFIQRRDLHARQLDNGSYACIHKPLTHNHMVWHLKGKITLGTYLLDQVNNARFVVLDADNDEELLKLRRTAVEIPSYVETSRRGGHLWIFFEESVAGELAKNFGLSVAKNFKLDVEVYPKQGHSDGPGSLIRVPFGIHRKSGERYPFINPDGSLLGTWKVQAQILSAPATVPMETVGKITYVPEMKARRMTESKIWDRVKGKVPVRDFIGAFVELKDSGSRAVGMCPFHDDKHPSFGVSVDGNYWNCFAGCGGGSIIDFWMKYKRIDFNEAVNELSKMLGVE